MIYTISDMLSSFKESATKQPSPKTPQIPEFVKIFEDFTKSLFEKYKNVAYGVDYQKIKEKQLKPDEYLAALFRLAYTNQLPQQELKNIVTKTWSLIPYLEKVKPQTAPQGSKETAWTMKSWALTPIYTTSPITKTTSFTNQTRNLLDQLAKYYINQLYYKYNMKPEPPEKPNIEFNINELPSNFKEILEREIEAKIKELETAPESSAPSWVMYRTPALLESWKEQMKNELFSKVAGIPTSTITLPEFYSLADLFEGLRKKVQIPPTVLVSNLLQAKKGTSNF